MSGQGDVPRSARAIPVLDAVCLLAVDIVLAEKVDPDFGRRDWIVASAALTLQQRGFARPRVQTSRVRPDEIDEDSCEGT